MSTATQEISGRGEATLRVAGKGEPSRVRVYQCVVWWWCGTRYDVRYDVQQAEICETETVRRASNVLAYYEL